MYFALSVRACQLWPVLATERYQTHVRDRLKIPSRWGSFNIEAAGNDKISLKIKQNSFHGWYVFPFMLYIKLLSLMHWESRNMLRLSFTWLDLPSRYTNRREGARVVQMKHHWNSCIHGGRGHWLRFRPTSDIMFDQWEKRKGEGLSYWYCSILSKVTCLRLSWLCSPTRAFSLAYPPIPHRPILGERLWWSIKTRTKRRARPE